MNEDEDEDYGDVYTQHIDPHVRQGAWEVTTLSGTKYVFASEAGVVRALRVPREYPDDLEMTLAEMLSAPVSVHMRRDGDSVPVRSTRHLVPNGGSEPGIRVGYEALLELPYLGTQPDGEKTVRRTTRVVRIRNMAS